MRTSDDQRAQLAAARELSPVANRALRPEHEPEREGIKTRHFHSVIATREQTAFVEHAIVHGFTEVQMQRAIATKAATEAKPYLTCNLARIRLLKARIQEQFKLETERTRPMTKEAQRRRLYASLRDAQGAKGPDGKWITAPNHQAIARYEHLLASVEGNFEAIKLDVDLVHREAITNVIGSMTTEHALELVKSYDEMMRMASETSQRTGKPLPALLPSPTTNVVNLAERKTG